MGYCYWHQIWKEKVEYKAEIQGFLVGMGKIRKEGLGVISSRSSRNIIDLCRKVVIRRYFMQVLCPFLPSGYAEWGISRDMPDG